MRTTIRSALATASALALAAPAFAQDTAPAAQTLPPSTTPAEGSTDRTAQPDNEANGEIVVTAQRRQERVTKVPISITVANQAQLERQQVNTLNDLNRVAPSLEIQAAPGQNTGGGGAIRGLGTQTFSAGAIASVGLVVDQVSQGNANIADLFDIARVEVLKGPQGTLFGLTTSAGVINITTNAPDPSTFSGRVRTELTNSGTAGSKFGDQIVQGVVNVPLSGNAAVRVAGVMNLRQGVDRNANTGDLNHNDRYGARARLLWTPTSDLTINLIGDYTHNRYTQGGDFFTFVRADPGVTAGLASCGVTPSSGNRSYCTDQSFADHSKNYGASLQLDYDAGPFTLTSISAYRRNIDQGFGAATNVLRADPLPILIENGAVNRRLSLFTQEFRITSPADKFLEYTAGFFYSHQRELRDPETLDVTLSPAPGVVIPIAHSLGNDDTITDESMAVFGQATAHVTQQLRLIAGGRYTSEGLSLDRYNFDIGAMNNFQRQSLEVDKVSWRLGAQYDLSARTMVYATASKGYKGGQIATPASPLSPYAVKPEIPTDYELGFKSTLFGGWVLDVNAFYDKVRNFQSQQCTINPATLAISCVQTNINGVKSRGAEINLFGRVFPGLNVNTGLIFAKATYPGGYVGTDGSTIGGTQLAYAPKYKFTFSGEYEHSLGGSLKGFVAGDTVWKSRIRYEANSIKESTYPQHWLVGSRIGVRTADDRFSLAVFGRNLFDVHEPLLFQSSLPQGGAANVGAIYGPQSFRQVGLQLEGKF